MDVVHGGMLNGTHESRIGVGLTRDTLIMDTMYNIFLLAPQLREQINSVRMIVIPLWRELSSSHGFLSDGQPC